MPRTVSLACQAVRTSPWGSLASRRPRRRVRPRSLIRSEADVRRRRAPYRGSPLQPLGPRVSFWTRLRTSSSRWLVKRVTWDGSATCRACGRTDRTRSGTGLTCPTPPSGSRPATPRAVTGTRLRRHQPSYQPLCRTGWWPPTSTTEVHHSLGTEPALPPEQRLTHPHSLDRPYPITNRLQEGFTPAAHLIVHRMPITTPFFGDLAGPISGSCSMKDLTLSEASATITNSPPDTNNGSPTTPPDRICNT